jgi:Flp pilus assembly protein CpaB
MRLIGVLIAIVIGLGVFMLANNFMKKEDIRPKERIVEVVKEVPQEVPTVDVFVARSDIPVGTSLETRHFDCQPWPTHLVLDSFIVSDGQSCRGTDLVGLVTRSAFQSREPIIRSKLSNRNNPGFLAAGLNEGNRAVTIAVDLLSSVAGFIFPGDRVDILINHRVDMGPADPENPNSRPLTKEIMEILLPDIKIIAIDQRAAGAQQGAKVPASVTVEVSKSDAQKLKLGEARGRLTLALRPLDKAASGEEEGIARPTGIDDLSRVVPPEYFPILYSNDGDYTIDESGQVSEIPIEIREEMNRRMGIRTATSTGGAASSRKKDTAEVRIVRGVQSEELEVSRP